MFEEAYSLSKKIPFWKTQKENPINYYVPQSEQPFKKTNDDGFDFNVTHRSKRLSSIAAGQERPLMLAATEALKNRPLSPLSKLKETRGFITVKRVQDNFETRNALCQKEVPNAKFNYKQPQPHQFRETDVLAFGQVDFNLSKIPDPLENPNFVSVYDKKPKYHF